MVGKELDTDNNTVEFRFPNVRKTFWRSATWNSSSYSASSRSYSVPSSPKIQIQHPLSGAEGECSASCTDSRNQISQEQNQSTRARVALPPLQLLSIARKSLDDWPSAALDDTGDCAPSTPGRRRIRNGLDIKLDLASLQRNTVEPTEIQLKRDKFAHFDKQCSRVANYHIYLGSDAVARDKEILKANGITHVLNCVGFVCPEYFKQELVYKTLWLQDSPCEDITSLLYDVFDYFEEVREQDGRVFVHCCQGVSRSTSLVIAYLMWRERSTFEDAFQCVKAARGVTNPNMGFACQLLQCQKRIHATPMSPNSMLRMYRLVPHSQYAPLHLVPKAISSPGAGSLDSRGAFVIHVPYSIMVWVGLDCDPKMAKAASAAANQLVRYERAEVPIQVIVEGHEGPEFWDCLVSCSASKDESNRKTPQYSGETYTENNTDYLKETLQPASLVEKQRKRNHVDVERVRLLGVGKRRVTDNDLDYNLYITARQGGVIPPVPFTVSGVSAIPTRVPEREDGWSLLWRKFLACQILPTKGTENANTTVLSPDTSMGSSSPHLSPCSAASMSSTHSGSHSPFESPIFSGNVSPDVVQNMVSKSQPTSSTHSRSDSPFESPIYSGNVSPDLVKSQLTSSTDSRSDSPFESPIYSGNVSPDLVQTMVSKSQPVVTSLSISRLTTSATNQSPNFTLVQRRGNIPSALRLPGLEDDPPPAPRGMSRKPKLPPMATAKYKDEKTADQFDDSNFSFEPVGEVCEGLVSNYTDHTTAPENNDGDIDIPVLPTPRVGNLECPESPCGRPQDDSDGDIDIPALPTSRVRYLEYRDSPCECPRDDGSTSLLYSWPELETIGMFDADDLDSKAAFILMKRENGQCVGLYVWVGRHTLWNGADESGKTCDAGDDTWCKVGHDFIVHKKLPIDVPIKIVREGDESEEFWDVFNHS